MEEVGGDDPGVNWLLADAQGTVRDVVRTATSESGGMSVSVVDHVFYNVYGRQDAQIAGDPQLQSPVGYQGLMNDPLAGFNSGSGEWWQRRQRREWRQRRERGKRRQLQQLQPARFRHGALLFGGDGLLRRGVGDLRHRRGPASKVAR